MKVDSSEADPVYDSRPSVDRNDYVRAKCTGTQSLFVIYSQTNYAAQSKSKVVENTTSENMGVPIKSLQGFDKQGLILFPHPNYCGQGHLFKQSDTNIADQFPPGKPEGVSAFIVTHGTWALYDRPNYQGIRIKVGSKDQFEPGTYIAHGGFDMVQSIKLL